MFVSRTTPVVIKSNLHPQVVCIDDVASQGKGQWIDDVAAIPASSELEIWTAKENWQPIISVTRKKGFEKLVAISSSAGYIEVTPNANIAPNAYLPYKIRGCTDYDHDLYNEYQKLYELGICWWHGESPINRGISFVDDHGCKIIPSCILHAVEEDQQWFLCGVEDAAVNGFDEFDSEHWEDAVTGPSNHIVIKGIEGLVTAQSLYLLAARCNNYRIVASRDDKTDTFQLEFNLMKKMRHVTQGELGAWHGQGEREEFDHDPQQYVYWIQTANGCIGAGIGSFLCDSRHQEDETSMQQVMA